MISLPHSSAIGSIHYVDCDACVSLLEARGRYHARGDEEGTQRIDVDLAAHCVERHAQGETPKRAPRLDDFAADTSTGKPVAGQVIGWDGAEVILRVPGEDEPRHSSTFRQATVAEEVSVKNALLNHRRRAW
ncbi:hypothetical protein CTZ27_03975 [Streptomyces griseocarneus]|nr:hypothetical protein CTZ27_03975 [Streptomyces griseocarneus]